MKKIIFVLCSITCLNVFAVDVECPNPNSIIPYTNFNYQAQASNGMLWSTFENSKIDTGSGFVLKSATLAANPLGSGGYQYGCDYKIEAPATPIKSWLTLFLFNQNAEPANTSNLGLKVEIPPSSEKFWELKKQDGYEYYICKYENDNTCDVRVSN